jgi:hypothetical protein
MQHVVEEAVVLQIVVGGIVVQQNVAPQIVVARAFLLQTVVARIVVLQTVVARIVVLQTVVARITNRCSSKLIPDLLVPPGTPGAENRNPDESRIWLDASGSHRLSGQYHGPLGPILVLFYSYLAQKQARWRPEQGLVCFR